MFMVAIALGLRSVFKGKLYWLVVAYGGFASVTLFTNELAMGGDRQGQGLGFIVWRFAKDGLGTDQGLQNDRSQLWADAVSMILDGGVLLGRTGANYLAEFDSVPHNTFLDVCLEAGLVGGLVFAVVYCSGLLKIVPARFRITRPQDVIFTMLVVCTGFLMTLSCLQHKTIWLYWGFALAALFRPRAASSGLAD